MKIISIITSVLPSKSDWLAETWASVAEQPLPLGWALEWILQVDGTETLKVDLPSDPRIKKQVNAATFGPAVSRNVGLARSVGDLIKVLDGDDQLTDSSLQRDIEILSSHPDVGWVTSSVLDVLPDGRHAGFEGDPPPGPIDRGTVVDYWRNHDHRALVHPATMCVRRKIIVGLGGWMALPSSEDTGLLLALDAVANGYFLSEPGLLYRKWSQQMTASSEHRDETSRAQRCALIDERATLLAGGLSELSNRD
jgi:glycosyltransferase involved in cell wall biosynthesis